LHFERLRLFSIKLSDLSSKQQKNSKLIVFEQIFDEISKNKLKFRENRQYSEKELLDKTDVSNDAERQSVIEEEKSYTGTYEYVSNTEPNILIQMFL
jgi:hypothetical protein